MHSDQVRGHSDAHQDCLGAVLAFAASPETQAKAAEELLQSDELKGYLDPLFVKRVVGYITNPKLDVEHQDVLMTLRALEKLPASRQAPLVYVLFEIWLTGFTTADEPVPGSDRHVNASTFLRSLVLAENAAPRMDGTLSPDVRNLFDRYLNVKFQDVSTYLPTLLALHNIAIVTTIRSRNDPVSVFGPDITAHAPELEMKKGFLPLAQIIQAANYDSAAVGALHKKLANFLFSQMISYGRPLAAIESVVDLALRHASPSHRGAVIMLLSDDAIRRARSQFELTEAERVRQEEEVRLGRPMTPEEEEHFIAQQQRAFILKQAILPLKEKFERVESQADEAGVDSKLALRFLQALGAVYADDREEFARIWRIDHGSILEIAGELPKLVDLARDHLYMMPEHLRTIRLVAAANQQLTRQEATTLELAEARVRTALGVKDVSGVQTVTSLPPVIFETELTDRTAPERELSCESYGRALHLVSFAIREYATRWSFAEVPSLVRAVLQEAANLRRHATTVDRDRVFLDRALTNGLVALGADGSRLVPCWTDDVACETSDLFEFILISRRDIDVRGDLIAELSDQFRKSCYSSVNFSPLEPIICHRLFLPRKSAEIQLFDVNRQRFYDEHVFLEADRTRAVCWTEGDNRAMCN